MYPRIVVYIVIMMLFFTDYSTCTSSERVLQYYLPQMLTTYRPIRVGADGNCLFRTVSKGLYGSESYHIELRLRAALEIALHSDSYDKNR